MCRHLALAYLTDNFNFKDINTLNKLVNYPLFNKYNQVEDYHAKTAREQYYFTARNLPLILNKIAKQIKNNQTQKVKNFLLSSCNHFMGIKIKQKQNKWVIYFYDPNDTLRHKKFIVHTINDFFNDFSYYHYFSEPIPSACLLSIETTTKKPMVNIEGDLNPDMEHLMLYLGHFGLIPYVKNLDSFITVSSKPQLFSIVNYHSHNSVKIYIDNLAENNLTESEKDKYLRLYMNVKTLLLRLFKLEKTKSIEVLITEILNTNLCDEYKYMLINVADQNKYNALEYFFSIGNVILVEKYIELILISKLTSNYKMKLLSLSFDKLIDYNTVGKKIISLIQLYSNIINKSNLSTEQKKLLISTVELIGDKRISKYKKSVYIYHNYKLYEYL